MSQKSIFEKWCCQEWF